MTTPSGIDTAEAGRLRILVVDDDEVDRMIVRRALARSGIGTDVVEADGAHAARRHLAAGPFDCAILDYNVPDGDGLSLLREMRTAPAAVPVVMLTGQGDEEVAVELMKAGAADYVPKGALTPERLVHSVRQAVTIGRAEEAARRAQDELRATAERLRQATESAEIGTWDFDPHGGRLEWDDRAREVFGIGAGAIPSYDTFFGQMLHADDRAPLERAIAEALDPAGPGTFRAEYRIRRPDGAARWVDARGQAYFAEVAGARRAVRFLGTILDITERKLVEESLREEARLVETLQRIGSALTAVLDQERIVQTVTDEATRLTGAQFGAFFYNVPNEKGEAYTLYAISGVPREAFSRFPMPRNTHIFEPTFRGTGIVRSDDVTKDPRYGKMAPHHGMPPGHLPVRSYLAVPVISHGGEVLGGLFFGHEHTGVFSGRHERLVQGIAGWAAVAMDNARLYAAQERARAEAEEAQRRAEHANRAKSDFLAAMSHDLRTPLNAIGGYLQLITEGIYGPVTEQQVEAMARIARAQQHLLSLINDVLNFARIEAGRLQLQLEPLALAALLGEVRGLIEPQVTARGLRFELEPPPAGVTLFADRERTLQVLLNLLGNAMKFTERGHVLLRAQVEGDGVAIAVEDTGRGIPADKLEAIFDPFVQAARSSAEREGVGLGLAISRELARAMGGDITVRSTPGAGSTFTLQLPRQPRAADHPADHVMAIGLDGTLVPPPVTSIPS